MAVALSRGTMQFLANDGGSGGCMGAYGNRVRGGGEGAPSRAEKSRWDQGRGQAGRSSAQGGEPGGQHTLAQPTVQVFGSSPDPESASKTARPSAAATACGEETKTKKTGQSDQVSHGGRFQRKKKERGRVVRRSEGLFWLLPEQLHNSLECVLFERLSSMPR